MLHSFQIFLGGTHFGTKGNILGTFERKICQFRKSEIFVFEDLRFLHFCTSDQYKQNMQRRIFRAIVNLFPSLFSNLIWN